MKILKKTLHLNYSEPKGEKVVQKNYTFDANIAVEDNVLKEVGDELAKLFIKSVENVTLTTKTLM